MNHLAKLALAEFRAVEIQAREITDQIVDRTDGVPLFIEELTKTVVESGIVTEAGGRYTLAGPVTPFAIPTTLHASLLARLDRLAPTREVAQIGAALGRSFSHELIGAVAGMPQQQLEDALAQLVNAELIFRRGTPPDAEYTFKHALVQDAAYSTMLRNRRQLLHARIVEMLEVQFLEIVAAQPQLLAQHCVQARLDQKAVGYRLKAGQQAVARSVMTEAAAQLRAGLDLLATLPDGPWREQQELDLQTALGPALFATRGFAAPEVGQTITRGRFLAERLDRTEYLVPLLYGQWVFHLSRAEHRWALSFGEQMEQIGEARNDNAALSLGHLMNGISRVLVGDFTTARRLFEQCHGLSDPAHRAVYASVTAEDPYAVMLVYLAQTVTYLGYVDQGRRRMNEALCEARRLDHACTLTLVLFCASGIARLIGSPHDAQQHAEEIVALSNKHGFPHRLGMGNIQLGWSATALGHAEEGVTLLTKGLSSLRATGTISGVRHGLAMLADAYAKLGQHAKSMSYLAEAEHSIEMGEECIAEAEVYRLRGDLLTAVESRRAAEQAYDQALAIARRQSAKIWEVRAATSLARLWRDQGKRAEARDLLAPVYDWFTEGFDTPVLKEAKALLEQLSA